jgi:twitching motility two-component system response regulator PilG
MQPLPNVTPMASSTFPSQALHPLTLLAQISSRQATGCLKVTTASEEWLLLLEQGRLNYVTNSNRPFDRLDAHLRRLSLQVPSLVSAVRVQVRLLFEQATAQHALAADYQAIDWLVQQQHLHPNQAANLIEALTKEVLEAFLGLRQGSYEFIEVDLLNNAPRYCQLNLRATVEECYGLLKQRRSNSPQNNGLLQRQSLQPLSSTSTTGTVASPGSNSGPSLNSPFKPQAKDHYTIACIDDSPTVLRAINEFLDDKIFSVLMIDDPVKALMQIIRNKPDLILLDVTMPNLDGYELCSLLRRHPEFKHTPIIMVTGNTGFIDRAKAKLVRASGYLTKPFGQSDLLKIIFKYLN